MLWPVLGVIGGALITGLITYVVARRNTSGDIRQSSPDKLWDVEVGLRRDMASALKDAFDRETALRAAMEKQGERIAKLEAEIEMLRKGIVG